MKTPLLGLLALIIALGSSSKKIKLFEKIVYNYDNSEYSKWYEDRDGKKHGWSVVFEREEKTFIKYYSRDTVLKDIELDGQDTIKYVVTQYKYIDGIIQNTTRLNKLKNDSIVSITTYKFNGKYYVADIKRDTGKQTPSKFSTDSCTVPDKLVEFKGGADSMYAFLEKNLKYPENARRSGIRGIVKINFTVEIDGKISQVKATGPLQHPDLEKEAIRVVKLSEGLWTVGTFCGLPKRSVIRIPITFEID